MFFRDGDFVAIDFETADYQRDSACAVALARVENNRIVQRMYRLIRPPRKTVVFSYLHGIKWEDVAREPTFGEIWPQLLPMIQGASFLAAHNASFDRSVLETCCQVSGLGIPQAKFLCTVNLARKILGIYPTQLPQVCSKLGIRLDHHNAASDADACAPIVIAARKKMTTPSVRKPGSGHGK
ncbi:MAG: 3'-5' exonuclease [Deltaproteobacteria bacterium]|nr:3'-5' exonuclease [Deltaproteobacteria bacterium]